MEIISHLPIPSMYGKIISLHEKPFQINQMYTTWKVDG